MKSTIKLVFLVPSLLLAASTVAPLSRAQAATYSRLETSFQLPLASEPFDYEKTDVRVQIRRAGGKSISLPAFFDGGTTWRARCTPSAAGRVAIDVAAGAHTVSLQNTGADWAAIQSIALTDYAPVLGAYGLGSDSFAAAWVYHSSGVKALGAQPTATGILALRSC